ncbi:hypothetical protein N7524_011849 [Penicillium chrysogenum]|nr:hypothetical protein N7524_011849 [Penicillium chrysogenum]
METKSGSTEIDHRPLQSPAARTDKVERRRSGQLAQQKFRRKRKEQAAAIQARLESLELNAQALEEQVAEWKSRALSAEQRIEESEKTVSGIQNIVESFQNTIQSIRQASDSLHNAAKALWIPRQRLGPSRLAGPSVSTRGMTPTTQLVDRARQSLSTTEPCGKRQRKNATYPAFIPNCPPSLTSSELVTFIFPNLFVFKLTWKFVPSPRFRETIEGTEAMDYYLECPNVERHRCSQRTQCHPIHHFGTLQRLERQLDESLDHYITITPDEILASGAVLSRVSLMPYGYTFIGKGIPGELQDDTFREAEASQPISHKLHQAKHGNPTGEY